MRFYPILSSAMKDRALSVAMITFPIIFILLNLSGLFVWRCPFFSYTGFRCGGCGMTRGITAALKGELRESLALHPFAIPLLLAWITYTAVQFLPGKSRIKAIDKIEIVEKKTGFVYIFITLFIIFGITRFIMEVCGDI